MIYKKVVPVTLLMVIGITFFSCKYDNVETVLCEDSNPDAVSFKHDIIPLFNKYCNSAGCHSGGNPPGHLDLTEPLAYSQLLKPGSGNVDTINPTFSVIYISMTNPSKIMPPAGKLYDCKINLVLKWIEQKAKNN